MKIVSNQENLITLYLHEWKKYSPDNYRELKDIIFRRVNTHSLITMLAQSGILQINELRQGLSIETSSYVGKIQLENVQIVIQPKIKEFKLLNLLQYAYDLRDLKLLSFTHFSFTSNLFHDILIFQLINEIRELFKKNLFLRYQQCEEDLAIPRGQINLNKYACRYQKETFTIPCIYYPRVKNCIFNQVLLAGLVLAQGMTDDQLLKTNIKKLIYLFKDEIETILLSFQLLDRVFQKMNRLWISYLPALKIIKILYRSNAISFNMNERKISLPGFLFDMNHFFQALVSRFFHDYIPEFHVTDQYRLQGMINYLPEYNPKNRKSPTPRPDFIIQEDGKIVAIIDTKYRDLWENNLPPDMLYQLAIYALSQGDNPTSIILYPVSHSYAQEARLVINEPILGRTRAKVILRPINLLRIDEIITERDTIYNQQSGNLYAKSLVFGD
jgi:5-methylcytosine-specific restriction enzyme subunit McrC